MDSSMPIELKDLVGRHVLSGVEMNNVSIKNEYGNDYEDCQCISFMIDGKTCTAIEDPQDGYRSSMREIKVSLTPLKTHFEPVEVMCEHVTGHEEYQSDILEIKDVKSGKVILEVGTDNTDDYYPFFVCRWQPENMYINQKPDIFKPI
jgi:hypothetical protein